MRVEFLRSNGILLFIGRCRTKGVPRPSWRMKPQESKELSFVASLTRRLNGGDGSAWLNLGYWGKERTSTSYPAAAEALAKTVADAAHLREYSDPIVIDVGCGLGESLTLWANEYGADMSGAALFKTRGQYSGDGGR